jgi:hypothetical protein
MPITPDEIKRAKSVFDNAFEELRKISPKFKAFLDQGGEIRARRQIKKLMRADENFSRAVLRFKIKTPEDIEECLKSCEEKFLDDNGCNSWELSKEISRELLRSFNKLKPNTEYWVKIFDILSLVQYKHCKAFITKQPNYIFGGAQGLSLIGIDKLYEAMREAEKKRQEAWVEEGKSIESFVKSNGGHFLAFDKESALINVDEDQNFPEPLKVEIPNEEKKEKVFLLPRVDISKGVEPTKYLFHPTVKEGISKGFFLVCFYNMKEGVEEVEEI